LAPSREALVQACARGDRAAPQSLYAATAPQLFGLALGILHSRELAEDVMQDSFILVWRHAHSFEPHRGTAMAWLARIVRNQCFDLMRRRGRESPLDETFMQSWEDPGPGPAELTALSRDARRLRGCLDELDEGPRRSMILAYYEGLTFVQVAGRLTQGNRTRRIGRIFLSRCVLDVLPPWFLGGLAAWSSFGRALAIWLTRGPGMPGGTICWRSC
jgi:RNA polymerase sigma-70 factor, ECF subfamily